MKSPEQGAQSFLYAAMEARFGVGEGGLFVKECRERKAVRADVVGDEEVQKRLWESSERTVEKLEKEGAARRAKERKEKEGEGVTMEAEQTGDGAATKTRRSRKV